MTSDLIEKFISVGNRKDKVLWIHFKSRVSIKGLFIFSGDYEEMKNKNFWRIVAESRQNEWEETKNTSCSRLFNGNEFTRLGDL